MKKVIIYMVFYAISFLCNPLAGMKVAHVGDVITTDLLPAKTRTTAVDYIDGNGTQRIREEVKEALRSVETDPDTVTVLIGPELGVQGTCDSINRIICVDESLGAPERASQRSATIYHEAYHLVDQIDQKAALAGFFCSALGFTASVIARLCFSENSLTSGLWKIGLFAALGACAGYVAFKTLGGETYCYRQGELRADRGAIEHLLKDKKYTPVVTMLATELADMSKMGDKGNRGNHPSYSIECANVIKSIHDNHCSISVVEKETSLNTLEKICKYPYKPKTGIFLLRDGQPVALAVTRLNVTDSLKKLLNDNQ
jgi:hypothetical protein